MLSLLLFPSSLRRFTAATCCMAAFFLLLLWSRPVRLEEMMECENDGPLGMVSGAISQITASSTYASSWARGCDTKYARLYQTNGYSWCPARKSSSEWLQVDLGVMSHVTGVMTQGRSDDREWVTQFRLSYSIDGIEDRFVTDSFGNQQIFEGNVDSYSVKHNYLEQPVRARFIKFHIHMWHEHPSLRVEVLGCQRCNRMLALPPYGRLTASSAKGKKRQKTCTEEYGHVVSNKGWCARKQDTMQYLELDIGPPTLVTGVVTKGRGDGRKPQWVKKYRISFSNDSLTWFFYREDPAIYSGFSQSGRSKPRVTRGAHLDKVFNGNTDRDTAVVHYLKYPFVARYVRFQPSEWENQVSMRAGLLGCPHRGECGMGYLRINNRSNCVANLAFKKVAWLNTGSSARVLRKRHTSFQSETVRNLGVNLDGEDLAASRAVDGVWPVTGAGSPRGSGLGSHNPMLNQGAGSSRLREDILQNCTMLEFKWPHNVNPSWHVDLRKETLVYGVIIHTPGDPETAWKQGEQDYQKRRLSNLDRLTVYVSNQEDDQGGQNLRRKSQPKVCGEVTRVNRAAFQPRIHIPCHFPIRGRYVKVEAHGVETGWDNQFAAALCEVMVY